MEDKSEYQNTGFLVVFLGVVAGAMLTGALLQSPRMVLGAVVLYVLAMVVNHCSVIELKKGGLGKLTRDGDVTQLKFHEVYETRGVLPLDGKFVVVVRDRKGKHWVFETLRQPPPVFQRLNDAYGTYVPYPPQASTASLAQPPTAAVSTTTDPATAG